MYPDAAEDICRALGLEPDRVRSFTLQCDAPGTFRLDASLLLKDDVLGDVAEVLRRYHVTLRRVDS